MRYSLSAAILPIGLAVALYLPVFVWLVQTWLDDPYYGHGFVVPVISGCIFWLRRGNLKGAGSPLPGVVVLGAGLLLYVLSHVPGIHFVAGLSLPIVIYGLIIYLSGRQAARDLSFPVLFLIFMIPLPFLGELASHLQTVAARSSAVIAASVGIPTAVTGNQIVIPAGRFIIGTPCSGISSLISLSALAALLAFVQQGSSWKRAALFLSAVPVAILGNTVRIASSLVVANRWGADIATSFFHGLSGMLLFLLTTATLILIGRLFRLRWRTVGEIAHG